MEIKVNDYTEVQRDGDWSHGLYIWLPERELSFGRAKAGIFQLDFVLNSSVTKLSGAVDYYLTEMQKAPETFAPGKYNIRVLDHERWIRHSVTVVIS